MKRTFPFIFLFVFIFSACNKEKRNERKIAGVWKLEYISSTVFDQNGNETVTESTIEGASLQLQNSDALYNYAYFENWNPIGQSSSFWDINFGKLHEINFHFEDGFTEYSFNVEKCTNQKLILTSYVSDDSLNLDQKTSWYFKR